MSHTMKNLDWQIRRTANELAGSPFHFTVFADSRGRIYTNGYGLNAQGTDKEKGLLRFAKKTPVGDRGIFWLAVNCANTWANGGVDKLPMKERAAWAYENWEFLERVATEPLKHREWLEADSPYCFLSAAREFVACNGDPNFESDLPIAMDATCSGAQILAALTKDRAAGEKVNLTRSSVRRDVYMEVANLACVLTVDHDFWGLEENRPDRSLAKKPTMTSMYSAGKRAHFGSVLDTLTERAEKRGVFKGLEGMPLYEAKQAFQTAHEPQAHFMAEILCESLKGVLPGPMEAMNNFKEVAKACSEAQQPICYTTIHGFLFKQAYRGRNKYRADVFMRGQRVQLVIHEMTNRIVAHRSITAASPNIVHSFDATLMLSTVLSLLENGVDDFMMIHDSFAVPAGHVDTLHQVIREEFVNLFSGNTLEDLYTAISMNAGITLDPPFVVGDLDITEVFDNEFMFS